MLLEEVDISLLVARIAVPAALVAVVVVVAILMFGGGSGYTVTAVFPNAGQIVKGNYVEVAGRPVGKVKSIELDGNAQARVKFSIGSGFDPGWRAIVLVAPPSNTSRSVPSTVPVASLMRLPISRMTLESSTGISPRSASASCCG